MRGGLAPTALDPLRKKVREKVTPRRASDKGCVSMTLDRCLKLLDWTPVAKFTGCHRHFRLCHHAKTRRFSSSLAMTINPLGDNQ